MTMQASIDKAISNLLSKNMDSVEDGLVFLGNWHGTYPTTLVLDPSLTAVDVRVFLFICQYTQDLTVGATAFPSYDLICKRLGISKPTLSNSITRLRLARWIALIKANVRDEAGRFRGQVMALSDSPMSLADAIEIDPDYMQLVENAALNYQDKKTNLLAQGVLVGIEEQMEKGANPLARRSPMVERAEAIASLDKEDGCFYGIANLANRERLKKESEKTLLGETEETELSTEKELKHPDKESLLGKKPDKEFLLGAESPDKESLLGAQVIDSIEEKNSLLGGSSTSTNSISNSTVRNFNFSNKTPVETVEALTDNPNLDWHSKILVINNADKAELSNLLKKQDADKQQILLDALAYRYESVQLRGAQPLRTGPIPYAKTLLYKLNRNELKPVKPTGMASNKQASSSSSQDISHRYYKEEIKPNNALNIEQTKRRVAGIASQLGIRIRRAG